MRNIYSRTWILLVAGLLLAIGCGDDGGSADVDASPQIDTGGDIDAPDEEVDAPPVSDMAHLLITEVAVTPSAAEFIEIYNPSDRAVDLSNYYVSDDHEYFKLPSALAEPPDNPNIDAVNDFIAKFPDGATIQAGEVLVLAMSHDQFAAEFAGLEPSFAFRETADPAKLMIDPAPGVPLVGTNTQVSNAGEPIVLLFWDGASDRVQDVDIVQLGEAATATNVIASKSGEMVDGPDADATPTTYRNDALTMPIGGMGEAGVDLSHKRIALEAGNEMQGVDGNGVTGDDETTESTAVTWDNAATFTAPTPGTIPVQLMP